MDSSKVQQQAADTILGRGVRFRIPAPLFLRLIGIRSVGVTLKPPHYGTMIAFANSAVAMGIDVSTLADGDIGQCHALMAKHGDGLTRVIAIAILRTKWRIRLFTGLVANWLKWSLTAQRMMELFLLYTLQSNLQDFITTIRYLQVQNPMERTKEKEKSHEESGS